TSVQPISARRTTRQAGLSRDGTAAGVSAAGLSAATVRVHDRHIRSRARTDLLRGMSHVATKMDIAGHPIRELPAVKGRAILHPPRIGTERGPRTGPEWPDSAQGANE